MSWGDVLKRRGVAGGLVVLGYFSIIGLLVFPGLTDISTHALGDYRNDVWASVWHGWWLKNHLWSVLRLDTYTDLIFFPHGVSLHEHIPILLAEFLFLPFQVVANPVVSWNLAVYLALVLNCLGMYFLAMHLFQDRYISFVVGLLFGVNAYVLGQVHNGSLDHITMVLIPFSMFTMIRLLEAPDWKTTSAAAAVLLLATLSNWYYGLYLCVFGFFYAIITIAGMARGERRRALVACLGAGALYTATVLPALLPLMRATILAKPSFLIEGSQAGSVVDITAFFIPGKEHLAPDIRSYLRPVYIGAVSLLLFGLAFRPRVRTRQVVIFGALALVFVVLSLGARLSVAGRVIRSLPLPSALLPVVSTFRAHALTTALVALVVGFGLAGLLGSVAFGWRRRGLQIGIPMLLLLEGALLSSAPFPLHETDMRVPRVYEAIAAEDEAFGIVEIPFDPFDQMFCGRYMFYQTTHGKSLVAAASYFPPFIPGYSNWTYVEQNLLLRTLLFPWEAGDVSGLEAGHPGIRESLDQLKRDGVKYLLVHNKRTPEHYQAQLADFLSDWLDEPQRWGDGIEVWSLGPAQLPEVP